VNIEAEPHNSK